MSHVAYSCQNSHELVKGRSRRQERVAAPPPHPPPSTAPRQSWIWKLLQYNMNLCDLSFRRTLADESKKEKVNYRRQFQVALF